MAASPENEEPKKQSWLLRLFESKLFDSSMAMTYMFNCKEPGVLEYIANKLFSFDESEVDFYLPQLINMYIMMHAVAEVNTPFAWWKTFLSIHRLSIPTWFLGVGALLTFLFKQLGFLRPTAVMPIFPQRRRHMVQGCGILFSAENWCPRSWPDQQMRGRQVSKATRWLALPHLNPLVLDLCLLPQDLMNSTPRCPLSLSSLKFTHASIIVAVPSFQFPVT